MATSKLELAVGTGQWDAGLKRAQQSLNSFTNAQGGLTQALDKESQKMGQFVQMMGRMDSTANTAKGQMNDYKRVLEQLTMQYNQMTDAQKKSVGQEYLQAIESIKQKFHQAKQSVEDFNRSISDIKTPEISSDAGAGGLLGGGKLGGMLQVFGGNMLTKAVDTMSDIVSKSLELQQSAEGIEMAFSRLNNPGLLDNLKEATHGTVSELELMKAAVKFNDFKLPVEELGTMLAFAQQKAKDTGQSVDYMVDSIVTGLGRKSLMILDNLGLSASEIKDKMSETGDMTKAVASIIREQMANSGEYVETAADRAARAAANQQNAMRNLGKSLAPLANVAASVFSGMTTGATKALETFVDYKEVIISATAVVGSYTIVANASTIAIAAQRAATVAATAAQNALNLAMKANPWGLVAAGLTAAVTAIVAYSSKSSQAAQQESDRHAVFLQQQQREQTERQRLADKAREEANIVNSAANEKIAKYKLLQTEWNKLQTIQEKNAFIRDNASAFDSLGAAVRNAGEAQKFFVDQSDKVIKSLEAMAKAEAFRSLLVDAYKRQGSFDAGNVDRNSYQLSTAEMRLLSPGSMKAGASLGRNQKEREQKLIQHIENFIKSQQELQQAGLTSSDYKWDYRSGGMSEMEAVFHMNETGLRKLNELRKNNLVEKTVNELNKDVERFKQQYETAVNEAAGISSGIKAFNGDGGGTSVDTTQKRVKDALDTYAQAVEQAKIELADGTINETDAKKKNYQAMMSLWKAYDDAYRNTKSSSYAEARDKMASEMNSLSAEIRVSAEAQKKIQKSAQELETAQKKLADAEQKLAEARASGSATAIYKANQAVEKQREEVRKIRYEIDVQSGKVPEWLPEDKKVTMTVTVEDADALAKIREIQGLTIEDKDVEVNTNAGEVAQELRGLDDVLLDGKTLTVTVEDADALAKIREIQGLTIEDKDVDVSTNAGEVVQELRGIDGVSLDGKTLTVTVEDADALAKIREIQGLTIEDKGVEVSTNAGKVAQELRGIGDVSFDGKTLTVTVEDADALAKIREIQGLTLEDKGVEVSTNAGEVAQELRGIGDVSLDGKTLTVTVEDADALAKIREVQGLKIDDKTIKIIPKVLPVKSGLENLKETITAEVKLDRMKVDETTLRNILKDAIQNGIDTTAIDFESLSEQILKGIDVPESAWQKILDDYNKLREAIGQEPVSIEFKSGGLKEGKKTKTSEDLSKFNQDFSKISGGVSSIVSGVQSMGIEIPKEIHSVIGVLTGISAILSGITSILTIIEITSAAKSVPVVGAFLSHGGSVPHAANGYYVPGKHYSNDMTPIMANAGELVLNTSSQNTLGNDIVQAQMLVGMIQGLFEGESPMLSRSAQGSLAGEMQGGGFGTLRLEAYVEGEKIHLVHNRFLKRSNQGELVTWR